MNDDFDIYEGKSFKDLCKDICFNQSNRKEQIETLISDLKPMIKTLNDAMVIIPLIKQYIDSGISNDEHLIKLAQICQKIISVHSNTNSDDDSFKLTEDERKELMKSINNISKSDVVVINPIIKKD